jgi:subtilisin family serine protease
MARSPLARRVALLAAALAGAGTLVAPGPARALLPGFCSLVGPVPTKALVRYDATGPAGAARAVAAAGGRVVGAIPPLRVVEAAFPNGAARDAAVAGLRSAGLTVQPEHAVHATRTPRDPYLGRQWGLFKVGAPKAWDRETGGTNAVTVAVLDTGVDLAHPDLAGRVTAGKDVVNDDDDPTDDHGHGTHVAGIVAAVANNRVGVTGVSWGARVLAVKVMDQDGTGSDCDIALGLVLAVRDGAKVLNLSIGADGVDCGTITQDALDYVHDNGALTVVSAGNAAQRKNPTSAPANCGNVLAVGATGVADRVAPFSTHHPYVGVSAPGVSILSTYWDPKKKTHGYATLSGTSMAAPFVAGLAALILSRHKDWTPDEVRTRITATAKDLGLPGKDDYYGTGRIDAARALAG